MKFLYQTEAALHIEQRVIQPQAAVVMALVGFASTLVLSWLSYKFFETPFLNLKERWTVRPADQTNSSFRLGNADRSTSAMK